MRRFTQVDVFADELMFGNPVAVVHDALIAREVAQDPQTVLEAFEAAHPRVDPLLAEQRERAIDREQADALLLDVLLHEPLEDGVQHAAEAQRHRRLGCALLDVVKLVAEGTLLEASEPAVREVFVLERHERISRRSRRSSSWGSSMETT